MTFASVEWGDYFSGISRNRATDTSSSLAFGPLVGVVVVVVETVFGAQEVTPPAR
jgi:hypothetical protein